MKSSKKNWSRDFGGRESDKKRLTAKALKLAEKSTEIKPYLCTNCQLRPAIGNGYPVCIACLDDYCDSEELDRFYANIESDNE